MPSARDGDHVTAVVFEAEGLAKHGEIYVRVTYGSQTQKTDESHKTRDPSWEKARFDFPYDEDVGKIKFEVRRIFFFFSFDH